MKGFSIAMYGALLLSLVTAASVVGLIAQKTDPIMGTWTIDFSKSEYSPGPAPKSQTIRYEPLQDGFFKRTTDTVNADSSTNHNEVVAKFDGKDYKIQGAPTNDTAAFSWLDDGTEQVTNKTDGKVTTVNKVVFSRDGKTLTQTQTGANPQGRTVRNVIVRSKQ